MRNGRQRALLASGFTLTMLGIGLVVLSRQAGSGGGRTFLDCFEAFTIGFGVLVMAFLAAILLCFSHTDDYTELVDCIFRQIAWFVVMWGLLLLGLAACFFSLT